MKNSQLDMFRASQEGRAALAPKTGYLEAIRDGTLNAPLMVSLGMGVDSVAMTIALIRLGRIPDLIIFADTKAEKPETYAYLETFGAWLKKFGCEIVVTSYMPVKAPYSSLEEELLTNGIIPGVAMGRSTCSVKWKQQAIHQYLKGVPEKGRRPAQPGWQPAKDAWARGEKIVKLIGYDAGAKDRRRKGVAEDEYYRSFFLLRELGYNRLDCANIILQENLPLPQKSSCFYCPASKSDELLFLHHFHPDLFRRAINIETNALPKLKTVEGLWRNTRKSDGRPGNWKQWALKEGLIIHDLTDPDGFKLVPQENPPLHYPDDEIGHLLAQQSSAPGLNLSKAKSS